MEKVGLVGEVGEDLVDNLLCPKVINIPDDYAMLCTQ